MEQYVFRCICFPTSFRVLYVEKTSRFSHRRRRGSIEVIFQSIHNYPLETIASRSTVQILSFDLDRLEAAFESIQPLAHEIAAA